MRFSNQHKIYLIGVIKKEIDKKLPPKLTEDEHIILKLVMTAVADAIINLPSED